MKKTIKLGQGIDDELLFGMRFDAVKKILGVPNEVDNSRLEDDEGETVAWIYDDLGMTLFFDEEDEWRLGTIEVDDKEYSLNGDKLLGRSFLDVKRTLENMGLGEIKEETFDIDETDGVDSRLLFSEDKCVNVWFESNVCCVIQWSAFWQNGKQIWVV
jgi:hypothetical protein